MSTDKEVLENFFSRKKSLKSENFSVFGETLYLQSMGVAELNERGLFIHTEKLTGRKSNPLVKMLLNEAEKFLG